MIQNMSGLKEILKAAGEAKEMFDELSDDAKKDGKNAPSESAGASDTAASGSSTKGVGASHVPENYRRFVESGTADPSVLVTREEAARLLGEPVKPASCAEFEEYIGVSYYCEDNSPRHLSTYVSASMPWDYLDTEVRGDAPGEDGIGDGAFFVDATLYVRSGATIFWIGGDKSIGKSTVREAVRLALGTIEK